MRIKLKTVLAIGAYIIYRLKGGPKVTDIFKAEAARMLGDILPGVVKPVNNSITLNDADYSVN